MRRARGRLALLLLLLGPGVAGAGGDLPARLQALGVIPGGPQPVPAFRLATPAGREMALADQRGRVVLLYFWATW